MFFGLESGSQRMLDHMDKGIRLDTARRTLFNHFPRKRDILDIWSDRRRERLASMFDDEALATVSAAKRVGRLFDALAMVNTDDPGMFQTDQPCDWFFVMRPR